MAGNLQRAENRLGSRLAVQESLRGLNKQCASGQRVPKSSGDKTDITVELRLQVSVVIMGEIDTLPEQQDRGDQPHSSEAA